MARELPEHDDIMREQCNQGTKLFAEAFNLTQNVLLQDIETVDRNAVTEALEALRIATEYAIESGKRRDKMTRKFERTIEACELLKDEDTTLAAIAKSVCRKYGLSQRDLKAQRRTKSLSTARQEFFWLARTLTDRSYPEIGRWCGKRDHTTVIHGVKKHIERIEARA